MGSGRRPGCPVGAGGAGQNHSFGTHGHKQIIAVPVNDTINVIGGAGRSGRQFRCIGTGQNDTAGSNSNKCGFAIGYGRKGKTAGIIGREPGPTAGGCVRDDFKDFIADIGWCFIIITGTSPDAHQAFIRRCIREDPIKTSVIGFIGGNGEPGGAVIGRIGDGYIIDGAGTGPGDWLNGVRFPAFPAVGRDHSEGGGSGND